MTTVATKNQTNLSGFEKWKSKNPEGTLKEYSLAVENVRKTLSFQSSPATVLHDGTVCIRNAATIQDIASISSEHVKVSATNQ